MAALTTDRKLTIVAGGSSRYRSHKVAANAVIKKGAALVTNATGYAEPATNAAAKKFLGWAQEAIDNTGGADGAKEVKYLTACAVKMKSDGTVTQANVGRTVWLLDDQTVKNAAGATPVVGGICESIEADGEVVVYGAPELATLT